MKYDVFNARIENFERNTCWNNQKKTYMSIFRKDSTFDFLNRRYLTLKISSETWRNSANRSTSLKFEFCQIFKSSIKIQKCLRMRKLYPGYHFWIIICFSNYNSMSANPNEIYCMCQMCSFLRSTKCILQIFHIVNFDPGYQLI